MCGFLKGLSGIPILGNIAGGLNEVISRPGDIVNNPGQFFGSAVGGALPFFAGPLAGAVGTGGMLPSWASTLLGAGTGQQGNMAPWLNSAMGAYGLLGGPRYQDAGMGDKALGYADQMGLAGSSLLNRSMEDIADPTAARLHDPNANLEDYLRGAGMEGLQTNYQIPSLQNMGSLSYMPNLIGQISDTAGIQNPMTGQGGTTANPYDLHQHEQEQFNQVANMVNQGKQSALSNLRTQLAARGITDPRALAAAEAQINIGHTNQLEQAHGQLASQAYANRQNAQSQLAQIFPQLYGLQNQRQQQGIGNALNYLQFGNQLGQQQFGNQQQRLGSAYNFLNAPMNAYESAAMRAIGMNQDAAKSQAENLRMLFSPWMSQNPYMGMFGNLGGGGAVGNVNQPFGGANGGQNTFYSPWGQDVSTNPYMPLDYTNDMMAYAS